MNEVHREYVIKTANLPKDKAEASWIDLKNEEQYRILRARRNILRAMNDN